MRIVVLGAGTVGIQIVKDLLLEGHDVVLIEKSSEVARMQDANLDCMVVNEDGSDAGILRQYCGEDTDFFIAVTGSDEVNIIACGVVGQRFKQATKIARVRNPSYASLLGAGALPFATVDHVIDAEHEAALSIYRALAHGAAGEVIEVGNRRLTLQPIVVADGSPLAQRSVAAIRRISDAEFLVPLVMREGEATIPKGDARIQVGDVVYFLGAAPALTKLFTAAGERPQKMRRVAIFGGGRIAEHLLDHITTPPPAGPTGSLIRRRSAPRLQSVTVFERNIERCKDLAARFPAVRIHHTDVSDEEALFEEDLSHYDAAVAVTGSQELNLVTAALAKLMGVRRSVALLISSSYLRVARRMQIDVTVSLKDTVARRIVSLTRAGGMSSLYAISEAELEILEGTVREGSPLAGRPLNQSDLPRDTLVLYVTRGGRTLMPDGSHTIEIGDQLGVLTRTRSIHRLEERFQGPS